MIITFLRHCGCPFAEKTFLSLRSAARENPDIDCVAVFHSSQSSIDKWLDAVGGAGPLKIIIDADRKTYAQWGLGVSSFSHVLSPSALWSVYKLGKEERIWNRPTESGSRWQKSGTFGVDREGIIKWGGPAPMADWIPNFEEGISAFAE